MGRRLPVQADLLLGYNPRWVEAPGPPISGLPLKKAPVFQNPSNATPRELITHSKTEHTVLRCHETAHRFVRRTNDREMLVYVDGSCLDQDGAHDVSSRRAGCVWVFKPDEYKKHERSHGLRLESQGPTGQEYPATSNRAELRAALGALQYRQWHGEGWQKMVIATDSEYLVLGITERIEKWAEKGWRTGAGKAVKNRDLWKALLERINELAGHGTEVVFWRISREYNAEADEAAKKAAMEPAVGPFTKHEGTLV